MMRPHIHAVTHISGVLNETGRIHLLHQPSASPLLLDGRFASLTDENLQLLFHVF